MKTKKKSGINASLQASCSNRTKEALLAVDQVLETLSEELAKGNFGERVSKDKLLISHRDVSALAGKNPNFLYKHPAKLADVEYALSELLKSFLSRSIPASFKIDHSSEIQRQYDRLADRAHLWWLELRAARSELRQLKTKLSPKIVGLK
ncbi:hypothetical protein G6L94_12005 [Agrobacterium rhizogenes]|jgi:hypothetical protein|nr:hypothetical protein [Rhizobium rhizogenes]NTI94413.1 hypothetical protein [Rhizobium rhizogenes]NTJ56880.1 hypothetical protein [Rhizobium rhizogenes]OCJ14895.1 hypothetical protein A6U89_22590 [Agrobacterium sp. B133/95]